MTTCVAVVLGLNYWTTCVTVIAGNISAGLIIALILEFFPWLNNYLFFIFLGIVALFLLYYFIAGKIKKHKIKNQTENTNDKTNETSLEK